MHHTASAADEHLVANHRWLREGGDIAVESKRPLELQLRHLCRTETGERGGSKASVVARGTPAVPGKGVIGTQRDRSIAAERRCRRRCIASGLAEKGRDGLAFVVAQLIGDGHHRAKIQGAQDPRGGHRLERVDARGPAVRWLVVTCGAAALIDRVARRTLGRGERARRDECEKDEKRDPRGHGRKFYQSVGR